MPSMQISLKKSTLLLSLFILFTNISAAATNNSLPNKTIAETAAQVSPLLNGQYIPANIEVTTSNGKKLALAEVINNKKTVLFFVSKMIFW